MLYLYCLKFVTVINTCPNRVFFTDPTESQINTLSRNTSRSPLRHHSLNPFTTKALRFRVLLWVSWTEQGLIQSWTAMVLRFNVGGKVLERVDSIRKKKWPWWLDILPFAIFYAIWMVTILPGIDIVDALIILGGLVSIHVLASLFTVWSVDFKCFTQYRKVM